MSNDALARAAFSPAPEEARPQRTVASLFLGALRRRWWLILGCCVIATGVALVLALVQTKEYSATASLLFRDPGFSNELFGVDAPSESGDEDREAATNVKLLDLHAVDQLAAEGLESELSANSVREKVSISSESKSDVASITVTDPDPHLAQELANVFATAYITFRRNADQQKIANARHLVDKRLTSLSGEERNSTVGESLANQASRLQTLQALQTGNAELVQKAELPTSPSSPKPIKDAVFAGIVGLLFGIGVALLLERMDRRLREVDEFEEIMGMPVLTAIADNKRMDSTLLSNSANDGTTASAGPSFQMLRTRLRYFNLDREVKTVVVTSAAPGDGKSTTAWETAVTAAAMGEKVLLIEVEFHRPTVASRHSLRPVPGLSELLTHQTPLEAVIQSSATTGATEMPACLDVITAGGYAPSPASMVESDQMRQLLATARATYDLVVIDSPPILVVPDAIPLVGMVDGVLVIGCFGKTTREEARRLRDQLEKLNAPVLGLAVNRVSRKAAAGSRYGYYYAGYGDPKKGESPTAPVSSEG